MLKKNVEREVCAYMEQEGRSTTSAEMGGERDNRCLEKELLRKKTEWKNNFFTSYLCKNL